jgi:hypothetical protein
MKSLIKQFIGVLIFANLASAGTCEQIVIPYATDSVVKFCLKTYDSGETDDNKKLSLQAAATFEAGDVKVQTDTATEGNAGTLPTDRGTCYTQPISIAESTGKLVEIRYVDQTDPAVWTPYCIQARTAGHSSAFYPTPGVDVVAISGNTTAADNAQLMFDGTGYVGGTAKLAVNSAQWGGSAVVGSSGYPTVTIKDGTGTGEIDTNAGAVVSTTTAGTCNALAANSVTASAIASNAIGATELADDATNKIADVTLRRQSVNVEASSYGDALNFQSLYGATAKQTNNMSVSGGNLNIYRADGTTLFKAQTLTSSSGAAPITGLGTN